MAGWRVPCGCWSERREKLTIAALNVEPDPSSVTRYLTSFALTPPQNFVSLPGLLTYVASLVVAVVVLPATRTVWPRVSRMCGIAVAARHERGSPTRSQSSWQSPVP